MTRESKIAMLVGFSFLIIIGILLADYGRNENPAALTTVAGDVQKSVNTPHNNSTENALVVPPVDSAPVHPVPTRSELHNDGVATATPTARPTANRPPVAEPPAIRAVAESVTPDVPNPQPEANGSSPEDARLPRNALPADLRKVVDAHPSDLTATDSSRSPNDAGVSAPPAAGPRKYVAVAGDTLNKIAGRTMGANTKANREAIIALNPTLKQNPNNIVVGRSYTIPAKPGAAAAAPAAPATPAPNAVAQNDPKAPASTPQYFYVVKENDNLWKIAAEQLGNGAAWETIKDMNKDVLKGGESVRPNMRLRLPAKPVASAQ